MSISAVHLSELAAGGELRNADETETYIVQTDSSESARTLRMLPAGNSAGLPTLGSLHAETGLTATKINVKRDPQSRPTNQVFYYEVSWGVPDYGGGGVNIEVEPTDEPPEIEWGGIELEETVSVDVDGVPFKNSAGEMYNPQPVRVILGASCTITRNQLANPAEICAQYSNTTNSDDFYGQPAGNAKFGMISARKLFWPGGEYWQVTFPITFKRDGWKLKVIDNGFNQLITGELVRIVTVDDSNNLIPTNIPSYLDGEGLELVPPADPVYYPADGFRMCEEMAWSALNLPNPFA